MMPWLCPDCGLISEDKVVWKYVEETRWKRRFCKECNEELYFVPEFNPSKSEETSLGFWLEVIKGDKVNERP